MWGFRLQAPPRSNPAVKSHFMAPAQIPAAQSPTTTMVWLALAIPVWNGARARHPAVNSMARQSLNGNPAIRMQHQTASEKAANNMNSQKILAAGQGSTATGANNTKAPRGGAMCVRIVYAPSVLPTSSRQRATKFSGLAKFCPRSQMRLAA